MTPKKPKRPDSKASKASGKPVPPAQYAKGVAELKSLLKKAEDEVSELSQTTDLLAEQVAALKSILAANDPLARKLAGKMEKMSQSSAQEPSHKKAAGKSTAPANKRTQPKKPKASGKPASKTGKKPNA